MVNGTDSTPSVSNIKDTRRKTLQYGAIFKDEGLRLLQIRYGSIIWLTAPRFIEDLRISACQNELHFSKSVVM